MKLNHSFLEIISCASLLFAAGCSSAPASSDHPDQNAVSDQNSSSSSDAAQESESAVVYFSATGTTKEAAEKIAQQTGSELIELVPADPYTAEDLDYANENSRVFLENENDSIVVELEDIPDVQDYPMIYLGYPIWWNQMPGAVETFVTQADLDGIKIVPFCTSGGSSIDGSVEQLRSMRNDAYITDGVRISSDGDIETLIAQASEN